MNEEHGKILTEKRQRNYGVYIKPIIEELEKQFKYFTKVSDCCWLIQSKKDSMMESFCVTTSVGHIIMSGDYGGVMVRPYGAEDWLPNWMAGATSITYFAEKVNSANQYHQCKEYSEEKARKNIEEIKESFLGRIDEKEKATKAKEFDELVERRIDMEHDYWTLISDIDATFQMYDLCEYDPTVYTRSIIWQHKCLVFWGNKVLDGIFENGEGTKKI